MAWAPAYFGDAQNKSPVVEHSRTMQNHVLLHTFDFTSRVILEWPGT